MERDEMITQAKRILLFDDIEAFAGSQTGYRNRMDLVFFDNGLGMREPGSHDRFVDIERSDFGNERVNELLAEIRESFVGVDSFEQKRKRGTYRYAVIRALDTTSISFVLNADSDRLDEARARINSFADTTSADTVVITYTDKRSEVSTSPDYEVVKGSDLLEATIAGAKLTVHVQGFFQNNLEAAQQMHEYVNDVVSEGGTLIDLYGGVGSFACTLGSRFERSIVIEEHEGSARLASENLDTNGITGEAIAADATALADYDPKRATVVTDPPRSGMSEDAAMALARMRPERVVYVSCNPTIAPRDLAYLHGYGIERAAVFDMFPGTDHYEMVVVLRRE